MKRLFDLSFSALGLFLLIPLMVLIAAAVWLESRGPAIVSRSHAGRAARPFDLYRFRTRVAPSVDGWASTEDAPHTEFGRILEETGLADLPQLWNILKGDLSVVGPKAVSIRDIENGKVPSGGKWSTARPGIINLATVNGFEDRPGAVPALQRSIFDAWYVENRSWLLDCEIVLRKAWNDLRRNLPLGSERY